jgi:hypothetical protein
MRCEVTSRPEGDLRSLHYLVRRVIWPIEVWTAGGQDPCRIVLGAGLVLARWSEVDGGGLEQHFAARFGVQASQRSAFESWTDKIYSMAAWVREAWQTRPHIDLPAWP